MMSDRAFLATLIGGIVLVLAAVFGSLYLAYGWKCDEQGDLMGRRTHFGFPEACMVEADDGRLVPMDQWRNVDGS